MSMEFLQSEQNAVRRRWILVLVDSADGITGKTGQTGTVQISKNGGAPAASTNTIVEVDSVNMPGHYYIELVAGELDTLGPISIYYKAATTLAFHDRGYITYDDPYAASGIMVSGGGTGGRSGLTKKEIEEIVNALREVIKEEIAAIEKDEVIDYSTKLDDILAAINMEEEEEPFDYSPILKAITAIEKPRDYSAEFKNIVSQINTFGTGHKIDVSSFSKVVETFQAKMQVGVSQIDASLAEVSKIKEGFAELQKLMEQFKSTLAEQSDMDKRFDAMTQGANNKKIEGLAVQIKQMMLTIVNMKYDILKEIAATPLKTQSKQPTKKK